MKSNNLKFSTKKVINYEGTKATIYVDIRLNDECKNGHQDFSITGGIYKGSGKADKNHLMGGCIHEEILKHFPEFAPFIDLHLCDFSGAPMYAIANGFYHLQNSSAETAKNYLRLTNREYKELAKAKDQYYFSFLLHQLEIPKRWKGEADKAIKHLEELTGKEFINDSTKSQLQEISEEKLQEISEKVKSGYYSEEAIHEREITKREEEKKKKIKDLKRYAAKKIKDLQDERDIKIYLLEKNIPINNVIFYTHINTLKFNWKDYEKKITESEFEEICENFDVNRWPGITLSLEGVKRYTPLNK